MASGLPINWSYAFPLALLLTKGFTALWSYSIAKRGIHISEEGTVKAQEQQPPSGSSPKPEPTLPPIGPLNGASENKQPLRQQLRRAALFALLLGLSAEITTWGKETYEIRASGKEKKEMAEKQELVAHGQAELGKQQRELGIKVAEDSELLRDIKVEEAHLVTKAGTLANIVDQRSRDLVGRVGVVNHTAGLAVSRVRRAAWDELKHFHQIGAKLEADGSKLDQTRVRQDALTLQQENLLWQTFRPLFPLQPFSVRYEMTFTGQCETFRHYFQRIGDALYQGKLSLNLPGCVVIDSSKASDIPYFPMATEPGEWSAFYLLVHSHGIISFPRNNKLGIFGHRDETLFECGHDTVKDPLTLDAQHPGQSRFILFIYPETNKIHLVVSTPKPRRFGANRGNVVSQLDLVGRVLRFELEFENIPFLSDDPNIQVSLDSISMQFGDASDYDTRDISFGPMDKFEYREANSLEFHKPLSARDLDLDSPDVPSVTKDGAGSSRRQP